LAPSCSGCCWPGAAALSVVVRFRRSRGVERQQLKWFTYAAALMFVFLLLSDILFPDSGLVAVLYGLVIALVPVAAGIAILRFRLYDIDRLINRTLVYGTLSALLGAVYGGAVLVLGQLFGGVGGNPPSWVVAGATLVVATLFQPARSRTQAVTGALTAAGTTRPRRCRPSASASATRLIWTPCRPSCSPWWTRRCSRPGLAVASTTDARLLAYSWQ
jgi:hypothetical protein